MHYNYEKYHLINVNAECLLDNETFNDFKASRSI